MSQEPLHGLDLERVASARELQRDHRTLGQRLAAQLRRPPVLGVVCWGLAGFVWFYPALIDVALGLGVAIGVISWRQRPVLPLKLPDRYAGLDPHELQPGTGKSQAACGLLLLGNDRFNSEELYHSDADARTHFLVLGGTGSGKTEAMTSLAAQTLLWGSGYTYVDGKGDASLWTKAFALARACGREDDLCVLNYMTGSTDVDPNAPEGDRLSNTFNPFLYGSADALTQLLVAQMAEAGGDSATWKDKAVGLLTAYVRALVAMRDRGRDENGRPFVLEVGALRRYITLDNLIHLYLCAREKVDGFTLPAAAMEALHSYLVSVPGFQDPAQLLEQQNGALNDAMIRARTYPTQPDSQTYLQHGYLQNQFGRLFNQLADVYGHIFRSGYAEIDLTDVVLQRRILIVMLPALEKSPDELANLGKLLIASLKTMLAVGLGARLEGTHREVIERRPTTAPSPYLGVFDEYGYYSVKGFAVVPAQARSLGFSVCFGGQDIQSFGKQSKEEADAIVGNTLTKIAMKIEDPKDTADLFEKVGGQAIAVQTSGFARGQDALLSGMYRDVPNATLERRARIDPLDLRAQRPGEAHVFFGTTIVRANLFYAGEFKARAYRLNRFVPLGPPPDNLGGLAKLLTPEGLRAAVKQVVEDTLDEWRIVQRLVNPDLPASDDPPGALDAFTESVVGDYLDRLKQMDQALAQAFRAMESPATESAAPLSLAKPGEPENLGESVGAGADRSRVELIIDAVDAVLGEAEAGADHPEDDAADPIASGLEYQGLVGDPVVAGHARHAQGDSAGFGNAVGRIDPDFVGVPLKAAPAVVDKLRRVDDS
ncbi:MAG: phosphoesterase [Gammaproteobacteria bacterium]|nr:phosphoesterase [Gammaproteobacteria bacterium]